MLPIDHRLDVDGGAPFGGDVVFAAINDGAVVHPGAEHGARGAAELVPRIVREYLAGALLHERLETLSPVPAGPRRSIRCPRCPC